MKESQKLWIHGKVKVSKTLLIYEKVKVSKTLLIYEKVKRLQSLQTALALPRSDSAAGSQEMALKH